MDWTGACDGHWEALNRVLPGVGDKPCVQLEAPSCSAAAVGPSRESPRTSTAANVLSHNEGRASSKGRTVASAAGYATFDGRAARIGSRTSARRVGPLKPYCGYTEARKCLFYTTKSHEKESKLPWGGCSNSNY
jgi:hypothetical protein